MTCRINIPSLMYNNCMNEAALLVPPINVRERIPFSAIEDVVKQIVTLFHPSRIVLFGSYGYGNPKPESDVDLLVVMETNLNEIRQAVEILKAITYRFGLDLLVYSPFRLAQRLQLGDPFVNEIINRGRVLYEAPNH